MQANCEATRDCPPASAAPHPPTFPPQPPTTPPPQPLTPTPVFTDHEVEHDVYDQLVKEAGHEDL